jgi:hypothetical protein
MGNEHPAEKKSKNHAISHISDEAFHGHILRVSDDVAIASPIYSTSTYLGMSRPLKPQALAEE